ncbi:hypothetical protein [Sorangium atrum]|uniref:Uncharacterized protein n=1 Tax=Sorangium atrum TaxID=2995308 RepID=A0ABT5C889_9BACT|nr:hypothetical protein [Sorangium aterium]MDC0682633.1 hypothetical protein [Sorangium aterium]
MRVPSFALAGVLLTASCTQAPIVIEGPCSDEERVHYPEWCEKYGGDGGQGGGGGGDGGGQGGSGGQGGAGGEAHSALCSGQCVSPAPLGWSGPALLWFGPPEATPECPADAPTIGYEGFADLQQVPKTCPTCACDPPEVSCSLPTAWAASSSSCPGDEPDAVATPFAAPDAWDGACTADGAIPADQDCNGEPCVQSLTIAAPSVTAGACTPRIEAPQPIPQNALWWATRATACVAGAHTACADATTCAPAAPPAFLTCIYHEGDAACPEGYPQRHVFYKDVLDGRDCTPCSCGEPTGASCTIMASVYRDAACTDLVASTLVDSSVPFCGVTPPGLGLGSKSAAVVEVEPGACAPQGGEPVGELQPAEPSTFCCIA